MRNDDVNIRGIVVFLGILAGTLVVVYAAVTALSRHLEKTAQEADEKAAQQAPPASLAAGRPYFPLPREQPVPVMDLKTLQATEDAELNSYGWVDKNAGVVRIPIERAMDLVIQPKEQR